MNDLSRALRELVLLFERLKTRYAVMGGLAVRVYGIPRPTYDIDFTLSIGRERIPALYDALRELGYTIPEQYASGWVDHVAGMAVVKARLYLAGHGIDVDLFLAESPYQQELLARHRREVVDEFELCLVSPEDLILLNLISHRPRDMADISDVLFTQGELDTAYLRRWAAELGVLRELEEALSDQA